MPDPAPGTDSPPRHVAFLRAINLGARRKFPKDAVAAAAASAGLTDLAVHLNTGNLAFRGHGSATELEARLEEAFAEAAGFEVPTVVLSAAELHDVVAAIEELDHGPGHHVAFLKAAPEPAAVAALEQAAGEGERLVVRGRAAHLLIGEQYHRARLTNALVERHLGTATARRHTVVRELVRRWC